MTLSEELKWRGFVNQTTYKDLAALDARPITFYWGVDPSADSMTIGNLAAAMMVKAFARHGHKPVLLVGGATGLIGDPDGKAQERDLLRPEEIDKNIQAITAQYGQIFQSYAYEVVNNQDWFKGVEYLDFLRDIGKHVPMRQMLGRDFVQTRLNDQGAGISYAEFSYVLIQAYDFLHLYKEKDVTLQLCGSDQWGNSIAGVDLIRRKTGGQAHVFSAPLIVDKTTGKKFGKSEAGAMWLEANKTSPYRFYQFWLNTDDDSAEDYLKVFTELDKDRVNEVMRAFNDNRAGRAAQKTLAYEVTKLIHGEEQAAITRHITEILFESGDYHRLAPVELELLAKEFKSFVNHGEFELIDVLTELELASSRGEARRLKESGAIYINGQKCPPEKQALTADDFLNGQYAILKKGKNSFAVVGRA